MALSKEEKYEYAWQFLRLNPKYIDFFETHSEEIETLRTQANSKRSQRNVNRIEAKKRLAEFNEDLSSRWGVKLLLDPLVTKVPKAKLKKLFIVEPAVVEFPHQPFHNPSHLFLKVNLHYDKTEIRNQVMDFVRDAKKQNDILTHFPKTEDLDKYLAILKNEKKFIKTKVSKSGRTSWTGWTALANQLHKQNENWYVTNQNLKQNLYPRAIDLRDGAPFSILKKLY